MRDVEVQERDGEVEVAGCWTYHWGARKRPFLHPVRTPSGLVLTRDAPVDHPWHHGLWFTIKFVDGDNFWEEVPPYGVLRHIGRPAVTGRGGGRVEVAGALRWIRPDRSTVAVEERRRLTHVPLASDAYAVDLDTTLVAPGGALLDRTPFTTWGGYGGLALRGPADWHDTRLVLGPGSGEGAGSPGERVLGDRVLGDRAPWCHLAGPVGEGDDAPAGLALFDAPTNRRHPVPWYGSTRAATYGDEGWSNFLNAAFLWDEPLRLEPHEALRIRHRVVVHDGWWSAEQVQDSYDAWLVELASDAHAAGDESRGR